MVGAVHDRVRKSAPVSDISIEWGELGKPVMACPSQESLLTFRVTTDEGRDVPNLLRATTKNLYLFPVLRPETVNGDEVALMFCIGKRRSGCKLQKSGLTGSTFSWSKGDPVSELLASSLK